MIKNYLLLLVLILSSQVFSQEIYLKAGKNFTNYDYKNSNGVSNPNLKSGSGNSYELGYSHGFTDQNFIYSLGLSLNDYNAVGGNSANSYRWDTKYLGVKAGLAYSLSPDRYYSDHKFDFLLNVGFLGQSIIYGKQQIDGVYYDLVHEEEFSGIVLESSIGCQVKYFIPSFGYLSLGYNLGHGINVSNSSEQKLAFTTHQIGLGFHFPLN
jgi:hypothetical protein